VSDKGSCEPLVLNPKAVKCLHTFEIQNTANVVVMNETAIYDYSSVRICLNANILIATFLFINRWCKAKKLSLMRGRGIPIHQHSTMGSTFSEVCLEQEKSHIFFLPLFCSIK
jgi:hypothetical protein